MVRLHQFLWRHSACAYEGDFLFILGSGRSGNTLLRKLLVERYRIYIPPETYAIADALMAFNRTPYLDWSERVRLVLSAFEYQEEFKTISLNGLYPVFKKCVQLSDEEQTFGHILKIMWGVWGREAGVDFDLLGDKTPFNTASINMIKRAFPNAYYLFITRHPYDVCASYVKMGRYADYRSAAQRWDMAHRNWLKMLRKNRKVKSKLVRYEELVTEPFASISNIGAWLGIEERNVDLGEELSWGDIDVYEHHSMVKSEVTTSSIGRGKQSLSQKDRDIIRDVVSHMCEKFEYEL
jgi:protein-tyrosine sulfotransferase